MRSTGLTFHHPYVFWLGCAGVAASVRTQHRRRPDRGRLEVFGGILAALLGIDARFGHFMLSALLTAVPMALAG